MIFNSKPLDTHFIPKEKFMSISSDFYVKSATQACIALNAIHITNSE
jgi:hypothetical protein